MSTPGGLEFYNKAVRISTVTNNTTRYSAKQAIVYDDYHYATGGGNSLYYYRAASTVFRELSKLSAENNSLNDWVLQSSIVNRAQGLQNTETITHDGTHWTSSDTINVNPVNGYYVNNTPVLTYTTLGSGVVNSSLTSVVTLTETSVQGSASVAVDTSILNISSSSDTSANVRTVKVSNKSTSGINGIGAEIDVKTALGGLQNITGLYILASDSGPGDTGKSLQIANSFLNAGDNYGVHVSGEKLNYFSGTLGVGVAVPSTETKIHASSASGTASAVRITDTGATNADWDIFGASNTTKLFRIRDVSGSVDRLTIDSVGDVTLGANVSVGSDLQFSTATKGIVFSDSTRLESFTDITNDGILQAIIFG